jgi:uncharacterized membrane protein
LENKNTKTDLEKTMREIPVNVPVECSDGRVGESTNLIVDPVKLVVTHVVVLDNSFPPVERLVTIDHIVETSPEKIRLGCTKHALANMERFVEKHYIKNEQASSTGSLMHPYATPVESGYLRIEEQHIPPGELAVQRGMRVLATDGDVGAVGELLLDPESGKITHIILLEGHVLGDSEIALPLSAIDHVSDDGIFLKLDRKVIQGLPAIPVKRAWKHVRSSDIELIVLVFNEVKGADQALKTIKQLSKEWGFVTLNTAVLIKDQKGDIRIKESADVDAKHGALFGAVTGGLIGLTRGPAGALIGAVTGAATGGTVARLKDMGFPDQELQSLKNSIQPNGSVLVILIEQAWVEKVLNRIADLEFQVWMQRISDEIVEKYIQE